MISFYENLYYNSLGGIDMHKNLIFDCGNVLFNWSPIDLATSFTDNKEDAEFFMKNIFPKWGMMDCGMEDDEFYNLIKPLVPERLLPNFRNLVDHWHTRFFEFEEMTSVIKNLKKNHNIYLLSNMPWHFVRMSNQFEIFSYFDGLCWSCEIEMAKPSDSIYEFILDHFGLDPKESIFFDDTMDNLIPCKKFGITPYLYKRQEFDKFIEYLKENEEYSD